MKTNLNTNPFKHSSKLKEAKELPPIFVIYPSSSRKTRPSKRKPSKRASSSKKKSRPIQRENYLMGYAIDQAWCVSCKFSEFLDILEFQQWLFLFESCAKSYIYPSLMDEFCASFNCDAGVCSAHVKGVNIKFDATYLANLFKVPNLGHSTYVKNKTKVRVNGVTESEIITFIGGNPKVTTTNHNLRNPLHKLLFNVVWRGVIPRSQKRSTVNLLDASLIFCIANKIQINFPALMISHMDHCIPNLHIPYGPLITVICQSFGVSLSNEESYPIKPENILQEKSLAKLNLKVVKGSVCFATDAGSDSDIIGEIMEESDEEVEEKEEEKEEDKEEENEGEEETGMTDEDDQSEGENFLVKKKMPRWSAVPKSTRRSGRIASQKKSKPTSPIHIDLDEESSEVPQRTPSPAPSDVPEGTPPSFSEVPSSPPQPVIPPSPPKSNLPPSSPKPNLPPSPPQTDLPPSPPPTSTTPFGFAAFSSSTGPSEIQQLKQEIKGMSSEMAAMRKQVADLQEKEIQGMAEIRKEVGCLKDQVGQLQKNLEDKMDSTFQSFRTEVNHSLQLILNTIKEVAFEEVTEEEATTKSAAA